MSNQWSFREGVAWTAPPAVAGLPFWRDRVPLLHHNAEFPKTQRSRFQWCSTGFRGCQLPSYSHCGTLMTWWSCEGAVVAPPHQSSTPSISQDLILEQVSMELWIDAGGVVELHHTCAGIPAARAPPWLRHTRVTSSLRQFYASLCI